MNFRFVVNQTGILLLVLGGVLLIVSGLSLVLPNETPAKGDTLAFALSGALSLMLGGVAWGATYRFEKSLERREALLLVALSWHIGCLMCAAPFLLWGRLSDGTPEARPFLNPINCYFESVSGLTTTGATILSGIDSLPKSILLWRGLMHWIGGLGIIVLFVAVLPTIGTGAKRLFRVEAGTSSEGVQPQIRETARVLGGIYLFLTLLAIAALKLSGQSWFDSVVLGFSVLATGGFANSDASLGNAQPLTLFVLVAFMVLAGINFGVYHQMLKRRFHAIWRDPELKMYLCMVVGSAVLVWLVIEPSVIQTTGGDVVDAPVEVAAHGIFSTVSLHTGTGFCSANYNDWATLAQWTVLMLMFIGGCVGSTTGGLKIFRIWVIIKILASQIERAFRPNVVRPLRIGNSSIDPEAKIDVFAFVVGYIGIIAAATALIFAIEPESNVDFLTGISASISCISNVGPGLAGIGPFDNYDFFSWQAKLILTQLMLLGRLEILAFLVLFSPRFWRDV